MTEGAARKESSWGQGHKDEKGSDKESGAEKHSQAKKVLDM